jgi:sirohydrochlorin cobaltochelatase
VKNGVVLAFHGIPGRVDWPLLDPFMALVKTWNPKCHIIPLAFAGPKHFAHAAGDHCEPLAGAVRELAARGCGRIVVQPLYVVAGEEYEALAACLARCRGASDVPGRLALGAPLLSGAADTLAVARALAAEAGPERPAKRAVVFMGHGSKAPAQRAYADLAEALSGLDPLLLLATLKQEPASPQSIQAVAGRLAASGVRSVALIPLTFAVGAHAVNDMASDRPGSFASVLSRAGLACDPVMTGLSRRAGVLGVWLEHLKAAMAARS